LGEACRESGFRKDSEMTDIVLRGIDVVMAERLRRIGQAHGWEMAETLLRVLDLGLDVFEGRDAVRLADHEAYVLQAAIVALQQVPNDAGFALIGRAEPLPRPTEEPDQSIAGRFELD